MVNLSENKQKKYIKVAFILSMVTVAYNIVEGIIATYFGASDETLALFGFGVDSFVEVLSGIGIAHMIVRMRKHPIEEKDRFEKNALQVTGTAFYILSTGLIIGAFWAILTAAEPETTQVGIIISIISLATMYFLYKSKMNVGNKLNSTPIISDAKCTKTCFYLSFILLISSGLYEVFSIPYIDAIGSIGIAWYAFKEGREAFENAASKKLGCSDECC